VTAFAPTFAQSRAYFESRLGLSFPARDRVAALCRFHPDTTKSLSIDLANGLWKCHASNIGGGLLDFERRLTNRPDPECWDTINATIGRPVREVTPFRGRTIVEMYPYRDAAGKVVFEAVRCEPKDFRQRRPDGKGGHIWNMDGVTRVPFNLPELITANVVLVAEGEKDAIALSKAAAHFPNGDGVPRYAASCNVGGAGKWMDAFSPYFAGKTVFVFQDNDKAGREHAQQVCISVSTFAQAVHLVAPRQYH
jgi:putative DNA primase/helicase